MSWPIGKTYDGGTFAVKGAEALAYAEATDDTNGAYRGPDAIAPPMFHVRPVIPLMLRMARDPELAIDMLRLVHGEHQMTFHHVIRDGDVLAIAGTLDAVEEKGSGTVFTFALKGRKADTTIFEGKTSYFVRGTAPKGPRGPRPTPPVPPPPTWSVEQAVTDDQALRYAAASGDDNPIHTDPEVAKKAGLPGCILHGLCTMAFAQRDLIGATGDPKALASLGVRFTGMVLPGEELRMAVWEDGKTRSFKTYGPAGKAVLVGTAEFR